MNNRRKFMQRAATASIAIGFCRGDSIECDAGFRWLAPNGTHFVRNEPRVSNLLAQTTKRVPLGYRPRLKGLVVIFPLRHPVTLTLNSGQTVFALASWAAQGYSRGLHWVGCSFEDFAGELLVL